VPGEPAVPEAAAFWDTRKSHAQRGSRAARIGHNHAEAVPGGGSSGCSCGESVAVHLPPHLSRISVNLPLRGLLWTSVDVRERDHDGLAVCQGFQSPQFDPSEQGFLRPARFHAATSARHVRNHRQSLPMRPRAMRRCPVSARLRIPRSMRRIIG
jgi:hypothetical protein